VTSVSCARAGDSRAGGSYTEKSGPGQVFVASERKGIWGTAEEVPGTAAVKPREYIGITSVSCHQGPGLGQPGEGSETSDRP
jgi:hypothetical protein